jgi:uncharacterized protein (TIGR02145 family)
MKWVSFQIRKCPWFGGVENTRGKDRHCFCVHTAEAKVDLVKNLSDHIKTRQQSATNKRSLFRNMKSKMKTKICLLGLVLINAAVFSQSLNEVKIGDQIWKTQNLNVDKFRNGDVITETTTDEDWEKANKNHQPAWSYYNNKRGNGKKYGKLYNWYAVNDPRGLAPIGWHIPSDAEWTILTNSLGGENEAGAKMKSQKGWNDNYNGTNSSGFSGYAGGSRLPLNAKKILNAKSTFKGMGDSGCWWSSTERNASHAYYRLLLIYSCSSGDVSRHDYYKKGGMYVRCLKD